MPTYTVCKYPDLVYDPDYQGFDEIADWMETLTKSERSHANRFQKALDDLND